VSEAQPPGKTVYHLALLTVWLLTDYRLAIESKVLDFLAAMNLHIRRAVPAEAGLLTEIAHAAKRHWGYPENWIRRWKSDLTITPES